MRFKTIREIDLMLLQKRDNALQTYREVRKSLEIKYKTEWLDSCISEDEKMAMCKAKEDFHKYSEIYDDFTQQQW